MAFTDLSVRNPFSVPFMPAAPDLFSSAALPATLLARRRNTLLDWAFYDVGNLTGEEYLALVTDTNREGAILVVWPTGARGENGVRKFDDYVALRAEPGKLLTRFAIAGVGSSDVGAAAFARTVANRYQEPVGAIVAGYGVADLLSEALGGWFVLGAANRLMNTYHASLGAAGGLAQTLQHQTKSLSAGNARDAAKTVVGLSDSDTLLRLLLDDDRAIASVAGHSKGSLSIACALEALVLTKKRAAITRAKRTRVATVGAVAAFPRGFDNLGQYIGGIDWFGGMNSQRSIARQTVPMAWHHLNTRIPMHLDFTEVLAQEPD